MVILAVGPEAEVDRKGFDRSVAASRVRLAEIEVPKKRKKGGKR